jgi:hypothetical protein
MRVASIQLLRRCAVLVALMFWQGGFMFYGAVVVPVGARVLDSHTRQGWVTRSVTNHLNLAGAAALALWASDLASRRDPTPRWYAWALWLSLVVLLVAQFSLHTRLDALLDPSARRIRDRPQFHFLHQIYLIVSTAQWTGALALLGLTVRAWSDEEKGVPEGTG